MTSGFRFSDINPINGKRLTRSLWRELPGDFTMILSDMYGFTPASWDGEVTDLVASDDPASVEMFQFTDRNPINGKSLCRSRFRDLPAYAVDILFKLHVNADLWNRLVREGSVLEVAGLDSQYPLPPSKVPTQRRAGSVRGVDA